ncbi:MAG: GNAT family N-acetyltransferase [Candidatus Bathyarchaeota archaeon]|nr:GNAT family N-acetyltransferase [Candidatus Bathyarchaeota archaeon]
MISLKKLSVMLVSGGETLLDEVNELWQKLNNMLLGCSKDFKQHYRTLTFEKRKLALQKKAANGEIRVTLAVNQNANEKAGYCISILNDEKVGEVESLFVSSAYRGRGIGDALMKDALAWMNVNGVEKKLVAFSAGNEQVFGFYMRYGFRLRRTVLEQV